MPPGSRVLVAVSGGPDSTALLLALRELGRDVTAAHFDHALRAGSERDAALVARLCSRLGVPLVAERRAAPLGRGSLQAAARAARYEFLERARRSAGAERIAVAHTADDSVETLLINLLRGTGVQGLRGIARSRPPVVRPLLDARRADVEAYLAAAALVALDDPSNRDPRHLRVRIRHRLLPALESRQPGLRERLARLAATAEAAAARLEALTPGSSRPELLAAPALLRARALARRYLEAAGPGPPLGRRHLEALERLTATWAVGAALDLPRRTRFRVLADGVRFEPGAPEPEGAPSPAASPPPLPRLATRACAGCAEPGAVHLKPGLLSVGRRQPGLRMRPAGSPGTRKLQDILTDARVPRAERDALPLVFRDGRLAWVPGVAVDLEHVTEQSRPGLHAELEAPPAAALSGVPAGSQPALSQPT